jgi:hypothetical protein
MEREDKGDQMAEKSRQPYSLFILFLVNILELQDKALRHHLIQF